MIDAENGPEAEAEVTEAAEIDAGAEIPAVESESEAEGGEGSGAEAPAEPESGASAGDETPNGDTLIPIAHPDGGTTDGLDKDKHGNFLCRAGDFAHYAAHGFVVVAEKVAAEVEKVL